MEKITMTVEEYDSKIRKAGHLGYFIGVTVMVIVQIIIHLIVG